jgi:hypothetical protein
MYVACALHSGYQMFSKKFSNIIYFSAVTWISSDCRDSQADPSFVSVALGDSTGVKSRSCICSLLYTASKVDSTEIDYVIFSVLTCFIPLCLSFSVYVYVYKQSYRLLTEFWVTVGVCLPLNFLCSQ